MQYRATASHPEPLSILGFGCMRFPRRLGAIDEAATFRLLRRAVEGGVNYFDTAYIYPGSEEALGKFLEQAGCRDRVNIATKLPHYLIRDSADLDRYFQEQLRRLRTDHVDYYLMHMLPGPDTWDRLKGYGIEAWIEEKKRAGQIGHLGFSYHGDSETFCRLVDAYDWEFCQIQYNYFDEHSQAGRRGLQYAAQRGLPVVIMEPLRGGRLASGLPERAKKRLAQAGTSPAVFSFRWLWDQEDVTVVLSGMNAMDVLEEDLQAADAARPGCFSEAERAMLDDVIVALNEKVKVGCTGCRYCMPCPKGVDIPGAFHRYNQYYTSGAFVALKEYFMCTALRPDPTRASQCVKCGRCKAHCPQGIDIPLELERAAKKLEPAVYRAAAWGARKWKRF